MFKLSLSERIGIERSRFALNAKQVPANVKTGCLVVTGLCFAISLKSGWQKKKADEEIAFRKSQLSQPIYVLSEEELVNPPWNKDNLQEWLYRPVEVTGRPIHYKNMQVPRKVFGQEGFDYIVPFVTKEDKVAENQSGLILNKGFIPKQNSVLSNNARIENTKKQTFIGYVSPCEELQHQVGGKGNDVTHRPVLMQTHRVDKWNNADLETMAKYCNFLNTEQTQLAMIELVDLKSKLEERSTDLYNMDLDQKQEYPYVKKLSGALQCKEMPWDLQNKSKNYFNAGILSGILSAGLILL